MTKTQKESRAAGRKPMGRFKLFALLAVAVPVGGLLLFAGLGAGYYFMAKDIPLTEKDMSAIVTVEEYVKALSLDVPIESGAAQVSKRQFAAGEVEWIYLYEVEDAPVFVSCDIHLELSSEDAVSAMDLTGKAMAWGLPGDCQLQSCDQLLKWGDASSSSWMMVEGEAVGNVFRARKGSMHLNLVMVGGVFDDPAAFAAFLGPKLEAAANLSAN